MTPAWSWSDHACRTCGSRLAQELRGNRATFHCGNCDATAEEDPHPLCGCGVPLVGADGRAGFRCVPNPHRGPASPAAIVIQFAVLDEQ